MRKISRILLANMILSLLVQCSPRTGRSLLTFFFDGVPEQDTVSVGSSMADPVVTDSISPEQEQAAQSKSSLFVHYPYEEKECAACHDYQSLGEMVEPEPGLCYLCHEDFSSEYDVLHGPVAGGYCTSCHDPHQAGNENLLVQTGRKLCLSCHDRQDVFKNMMHQDLGDMECTDCHNPHGGEDRYILY